MSELSKQQEDILVFINELQNSGVDVDSFKEAVSNEFLESDNALTPEDAYDALEENDYIDNDFGLTLKGKQYLDSMKTRKEREEKMKQEQTGNTTINYNISGTVKGNVNANVNSNTVEEKTGIISHIKELTGIKNTGIETKFK